MFAFGIVVFFVAYIRVSWYSTYCGFKEYVYYIPLVTLGVFNMIPSLAPSVSLLLLNADIYHGICTVLFGSKNKDVYFI